MEKVTLSTSTDLVPIEIRQDVCPTFKRIAEIVAVALLCLTFAAALGGCIAFAISPAGIVISAVLAGTIGAVVGVIIGLKIKHIPIEHDYRIQTLDQIDKAMEKKPLIREQILKVKSIFAKHPIVFGQAYDNHALHQSITVITEEMKKRVDLQTIWEKFLTTLQNHPVFNPDGGEVLLDFRLERERLKNVKLGVSEVKDLNPYSLGLEETLDQLVALEHECFTNAYSMNKEAMRKAMDKPEHGFLIMRSQQTNDIIGFLRYWPNKEGILNIAGIGRAADAHHLGVGKLLMETFLKQFGNREILLHVRDTNRDAITLYQNCGFEITQTLPAYYQYPAEAAHEMRRQVPQTLAISA